MPEINETTPRTQITIAGQTFNAPQPYGQGDVLTANEASALNQTYAENLRNNFASKVKEASEAGTFDLEVFQSRFDEYASDYEFGVRTGGGRTGDPVQAEAMSICRDLVRKAIVKQNKKLADYSAAKITELAKSQLAKSDDPKTQQIYATARTRVDSQKDLDVDVEAGDLTEDEQPTSSRRKKSAEAEAA